MRALRAIWMLFLVTDVNRFEHAALKGNGLEHPDILESIRPENPIYGKNRRTSLMPF